MATIKSYTDISQSKKLAEILPLPHESADMWYRNDGESITGRPEVRCGSFTGFDSINIPCWSLAALLGVLPFIDFTTPQLIGTPKTLYVCKYNDDLRSHPYDNAVDACYEMILKLHEQNLI